MELRAGAGPASPTVPATGSHEGCGRQRHLIGNGAGQSARLGPKREAKAMCNSDVKHCSTVA